VALGNGAVPDAGTIYSAALSCPGPGTACLVDAALLEPACGPLPVALDWQTPPRDRVAEALRIDEARPVLEALGVTADERHHMLSLDILETLGVTIRPEDFHPVVERFRPLLLEAIRGPVAIAVEVLMAKARHCVA
jgi:hypothetical protein